MEINFIKQAFKKGAKLVISSSIKKYQQNS